MLLEPYETPKTNLVSGIPITESILEQKALNVYSAKEYIVELVDRKEIKDFIEKWHYSHSINGLRSSYCFALYYFDKESESKVMIGAMIYGKLAMASVWKKYGSSEDDVIELRRLAMIDSTARNSESYFIGKTLKWLKSNTTIKKVVSYSDLYYNHKGTIYKATNFVEVGQTSSGRKIVYNDKIYHDKAIRSKYTNGVLKPFAIKIKKALDTGDAYYIKTPPKNIFIYTLRN